MKENITNHPDLEEALQEKLSEKTSSTVQPDELNVGVEGSDIDTSPLPKGMREKVETVEVTTLKPKN
jgi:hypothetical protein